MTGPLVELVGGGGDVRVLTTLHPVPSTYPHPPSVRMSYPALTPTRAPPPAPTRQVVRNGYANVKEDGFASLFWNRRWMILKEDTLTFHKNEVRWQRLFHQYALV